VMWATSPVAAAWPTGISKAIRHQRIQVGLFLMAEECMYLLRWACCKLSDPGAGSFARQDRRPIEGIPRLVSLFRPVQYLADLPCQLSLSDRFFEQVNSLVKSALMHDGVPRVTCHVKNAEIGSHCLGTSA